MLYQFDLVTFGRVDERNFAAATCMRHVRQRITFRSRFSRELFQVVHFKCQMREVRTNHDRPALIEFANLNLLFALGGFQENELRAATGCLAVQLLEPEDIFIERDRFFQILHAITGVQEFFDHTVSYCSDSGLNSNSTTGSETRNFTKPHELTQSD